MKKTIAFLTYFIVTLLLQPSLYSTPESGVKAIVQRSNVTMRRWPSVKSKVIFTLNKGDRLDFWRKRIVGKVMWYFVSKYFPESNKSLDGWVLSGDVELKKL